MIYIYKNKKGCPFIEWLNIVKEREPAVYRKVNNMLDQMKNNTLPFVRPNVKKTPPQRTGCPCLYKIRLGHYRLFFLWQNHNYYLLHAFRKSSNATPDKEFRRVKKEIAEATYINYEN